MSGAAAPSTALTDISGLGLVPCCVNALSFCENEGQAQSDGTQSQVTYYTAWVAAFDFSAPRLMFTNFYWSTAAGQNGEHPGPGPLLIRASIATDTTTTSGTPDRTYVPVTFGQQPAYALQPGQVVFSDPVPIEWNQGDVFIIRVCVTAAPGTKWPLAGPLQDSTWISQTSIIGAGVPGFINGQDTTRSGFAVPANTGTAVNLYGPAALFALPGSSGLPGVLAVGDSIARGFGDKFPGCQGAQVQEEGFLTRALRGTGHGVVQLGTGGDRADQFISRGWVQCRRMMATNCKHAVVNIGRNDLSAGATGAQIQTRLVTLWRQVAGWGVKVWATTIPPRATSTDRFITTANQTTDASNAARVTVNAWIRGGAPIDPTTKAPVAVGTPGALVAGAAGHPLAGTFDVATTVESAMDSGIWSVPFTGTGDTTSGIALVNNATGAWSKGMAICGPNINFAYVKSVAGSTLTLNLSASSTTVGTTIASVHCTSDGIHPSAQANALMAGAVTPASFT